MPGIKIVKYRAFMKCYALTNVECGKLKIIGERAFEYCRSLKSISLPSARIVVDWAFNACNNLIGVKFGDKLERIETCAFYECYSLERITIPLKVSIISARNIFQLCKSLKHVDLVEGELHETVAALQLEEWRNDMNYEINSINQTLPNLHAGYLNVNWYDARERKVSYGEKARAIRRWLRSVLGKIIHYQEEHQRILEAAATTLQFTLPQDIAMNKVLPFLELPSHTFEVEEEQEE